MSDKIEPLIMPKWGIEMDEGKLTEWLVEEGTSFSKGDPLVVIETDKISNEVEAEIDSKLRKKVVQSDGTYPVGALLGIFAPDGVSDEEIDNFVNAYVAPDTSLNLQVQVPLSPLLPLLLKKFLIMLNLQQALNYLPRLQKILIFLQKLGKLHLS
jgi:pyruvate/2-oxoglutarate dehydrogenase complex dihydrolipoamide acyltransferase (E2) component